ncbi:MAG TPA: hydroxymethylbilane synthase [Acidimicrobiia bacterium]
MSSGVAASIRIATRGSRLARWQAEHVGQLLRDAHADGLGIEPELVVVSTTGDVQRDVPIHALGGTGVFVKEVQQAVLDGRADIAVHSAKDLPSDTPAGLLLACVPERGDARDALVGARLDEIPHGGTVGTGSVRRRAQLAALRPDLVFAELRGNIETRLERVLGPERHYDAIVMAVAALQRLERTDAIAEIIAIDTMVPQIAQGALAIECRADDDATRVALAAIDHPASHRCVTAERAFLAAVGGGCDLPVAAHAVVEGSKIVLVAEQFDGVGAPARRVRVEGTDPETVGRDAAQSAT